MSRPPEEPEAPRSTVRPYVQQGGSVEPALPAEPPPDTPAPPAIGGGDVRRLRPYLLTGGRTRSEQIEFEIEAQVLTTRVGRGALHRHAYEQRDILLLCDQPIAIAEVASRLNLHLGVVRVLVGDLIAAGHLTVRRPEVGAHRDVDIIERVIRGLQSIH